LESDVSKTTEETREAWRVEKQIRARIAEEIAQALEDLAGTWSTPSNLAEIPASWDAHHLIVRNASETTYKNAAKVAREFGGSTRNER
jgi:hypothetical protein